MSAMVTSRSYLDCLQSWAPEFMRGLYEIPGRPDLACYGTGTNHWGVQTNQKGFAACAVLAADPGYDAAAGGVSRERLLECALKTLRFSLESHLAGGFSCLDGEQWGHTWISMLGLERMMHGVEALEGNLADSERALLKKVLISECDWLMDDYYRTRSDQPGVIQAGTVENNDPENNIWAGALLHRVAALYPDTPRSDAYREKGSRFLVNGISVAADAAERTVVDGRPVAERHIGANFFPSYALNHHRYLNVGYMVICLSNLAMLHFSCRRAGRKPPEALYHHAADLWKLVKLCTFEDGRLLRIGGDTRVRYCYCQDYAIPTWLMMLDWLDDRDCVAFESGWLAQVRREMANNGDGSFLADRCRVMAGVSPLYLTRLESDRAATLAMGAFWRRELDLPEEPARPAAAVSVTGAWSDDYHGACLARGENRIASWTWLAAERPTGLCLPAGDSALAEWRHNLAGEVKGIGRVNYQDLAGYRQVVFPGGFLTWGRTVFCSEGMVAEGPAVVEKTAAQEIACAVLPDDATMVVLQRARTLRRVDLVSVKGLFFQVPNDLFNGYRRSYRFGGRELEAGGRDDREETIHVAPARLQVGERLLLSALYGQDQLFIHRPGKRQVGLSVRQDKAAAGGMLRVDEICAPCLLGRRNYDSGAVLYDHGLVIRVLPAEAGEGDRARREERVEAPGSPEVRLVVVSGNDGRDYLLAVNFGREPSAPVFSIASAGRLAAIDGGGSFATGPGGTFRPELAGEECRLFRLEK